MKHIVTIDYSITNVVTRETWNCEYSHEGTEDRDTSVAEAMYIVAAVILNSYNTGTDEKHVISGYKVSSVITK